MTKLEPFEFRGKFGTYTVIAVGRYYDNRRRAIQLLDSHDGSLVAVATCNVPDEELGEDEVFIKNYSENDGMLDSMLAAEFIEEPTGRVPTGFVFVEHCKLTEKGKALFD